MTAPKNTLFDLIRNVAHDEERGIVFINSATDHQFVSYSNFYMRAARIACVLAERLKSGPHHIIVFVNDQLDFLTCFWACVLAHKIPVPVSANPKASDIDKCIAVFKVLGDANIIACTVLSNRLLASVENEKDLHARLRMSLLLTDQISTGRVDETRLKCSHPQDTAFIQFTSGSTGSPKGVMLSHKNLITNVVDIHRTITSLGSTEEKILSWMPLTHDMGLIGFHLVPMFMGWTHYIMPTDLFARRPLLWLNCISQYRISITGSPNFGFCHVVNAMRRSREIKEVDLSSLRMIINGAEPISKNACDQFIQMTTQHKITQEVIVPVYGLAEASLAVTMSNPGEGVQGVYLDRTKLRIGCPVSIVTKDDSSALWFSYVGTKVYSCDLRIADNNGNPAGELTLGEIHIAGPNVATGYYGGGSTLKNGWLPTGDLGFIHDGQLVVTGRIKNLIILNGQNYHPQDFERLIAGKLHLEEYSVCACSIPGETFGEELVIFIRHSFPSIKEFYAMVMDIKKVVMEHFGVSVKEVLQVDKIPRTSSGKVQYYKLVQLFQSGAFDEMIALLKEYNQQNKRDQSADALVQLVRTSLNADVDYNSNLFDVGLNSMRAARLVYDLNIAFSVNISIHDILQNPTVSELASKLFEDQFAQVRDITPSAHSDSFLINARLRKFWMLQQLSQNPIKFIIAGAIRSERRFDREVLSRAMEIIVIRHPMLRARFVNTNADIMCHIDSYDARRFGVTFFENYSSFALDEQSIREVDGFLYRRFDLERGPLFRSACFVFKDYDVLAIACHHIVSDGWSMQIIQDELATVIATLAQNKAVVLEPVQLSYKDFIGWEEELQNNPLWEKYRSYWLKDLKGDLEKVNLPFARRIVMEQNGKYGQYNCTFSSEELYLIDSASIACRVTSFVVCLTLVTSLLQKYSQQREIIVGTDFNGRVLRKFSNVVGYFLNTVALRFDIPDATSFSDRIQHVNDKFLKAAEHQLYPFEQLVRDLALDPGDELFNVLVLYREFDSYKGFSDLLGQLNVAEFSTRQVPAFSDIQFEFSRSSTGLTLKISYSLDIMLPADIELFAQRLRVSIKANLGETVER